MYKLTCALPMFRTKDIGWLALESLCRQEDIDFDWELVVVEEPEDCFSEDRLRSYSERLEAVGCKSIQYKQLEEWIPLAQKWKLIADMSNSFGYLLVAADCYSHPKRLSQTNELLQEYEWTQSPLGPFYNIESDSQCIYDQQLANGHPCCLNMATRTELMRVIPMSDRRRSVDGWIYDQIGMHLLRPPKVGYNKSDDWKRGVDTHGLNNISSGRGSKISLEPAPPFRKAHDDEPSQLSDVVPEDIASRLLELRDAAIARTTYIRMGISG